MRKMLCMVLASSVALCGCGIPKRAAPEEGNKRVEHVDQAASLHTSITSIAPWELIKEKLKPGFKLEAPDALAKSIPTTLVRLDRVLDILKFQLSVTPPIVKQSSSVTTTSGTGKDTSVASEATTQKLAPDLPAATPPTGLAASAPTFQTPPDTPADALLQYQAAANLLRDVAVLNEEIDNVSKRTGQDAFLTRIQISVMPLRHGLGYDVYANLSMFGSTGSFDPESGTRTQGEMMPVTPLVVPILSTDSIQATRRTVSSTAQREIGLALNLLRGFGAAGASFGRQQSNDNEAAGAELESVITVGRLSDNTIRIRMGADPLPGGGYAMLPRTFNISAVVFVPKTAKQLYYVSRLSLHHVLDGAELSVERSPSYSASIQRIVKHSQRDFPGLTSKHLFNPLDDAVFHGDFKLFDDRLRWFKNINSTELETQRQVMYLWAELTALNRQSRHASSLVDIPRPPPVQCPSRQQLVSFSADDAGVSVSLGLGKYLRENALGAKLVVSKCTTAAPAVTASRKPSADRGTATPKPDGAAPACSPDPSSRLYLDASSVQVVQGGHGISLQFPPIDQVQMLGPRISKVAPYALELMGCPDVAAGAPTEYVFVASVAKKPAAEADGPPPALIADSRVLVADKGRTGLAAVVVQAAGKTNLKLAVRNATVVSLTDDAGKPLVRNNAAWDVADGGRYLLTLRNLSESALVQLELGSQAPNTPKATPLASTELRVDAKN